MPKVRTFIKGEGHADFYPGFNVNFIPGKPPNLVCFNGEDEVERIDLSDMETNDLHDLVASKGYRRQLPMSLAAKRDKGEDVTADDWTEYLEARAVRTKAREEWVANRSQRLLDEWEQAPKQPELGVAGTWLIEKKKDQLKGTKGAQFRMSTDLGDKAPGVQMAMWGSEFEGSLSGEGWVKLSTEYGDRFLPVVVQDIRILRPLFGAGRSKDEL